MNKQPNPLFRHLLEQLGQALDITEAQYRTAVRTYTEVGQYLSEEHSPIAQYGPEILPQGSFLLGTMIRPVHEDDDLDIDLVCRLSAKHPDWTPHYLKQLIGNHLKRHPDYASMLQQPEGRRCWTLVYPEIDRYHLDILPGVADPAAEATEAVEPALCITDCEADGYHTCTDPKRWLKSHPLGYAQWFAQRAACFGDTLMRRIQPVPQVKPYKRPLQRMVQVLKRHRDVMFAGSEDKPASILITTLAARVYCGQNDVGQGLMEVIQGLLQPVEVRYDPGRGKWMKWVENPVLPQENYADKWLDYPSREAAFYKWTEQLASDILDAAAQPTEASILRSFDRSLLAAHAIRKWETTKFR